jgi:hypothetical protein
MEHTEVVSTDDRIKHPSEGPTIRARILRLRRSPRFHVDQVSSKVQGEWSDWSQWGDFTDWMK